MKAQTPTCRNQAFNRTELFVVIGVFIVLVAAIFLPALAAAKRKASRINCVNCVHQINLAFKTWEADNGDKYPMQFALTNNETMKLISSGSAYVLWRTMSNELSTPKVLHCPEDTKRAWPTDFTSDFSDANISYFFCLEAADTYPQMILDGDDNLAVNGVRVKPGILDLPTTGSLTWTKERHHGGGSVGMADGSVLQITPSSLWANMTAATNGTPFSTYRWVIP